MASENLLSIELNAQELQQIDRALSDLEMVTQNKFINLTPDERKEYSRIGHKTEDWIVRVKNYMEQYPELVMKHIDTTEFYKDFEVRQALLPRLRRLNAIFNRFEDIAMLIGSDLYHSGIVFYRGAMRLMPRQSMLICRNSSLEELASPKKMKKIILKQTTTPLKQRNKYK